MYAWFKENLPIKKKLRLAFYLQLLTMAALVVLGAFRAELMLGSDMLLAAQAVLVVGVATMILIMHRAMANPYVTTVVRMEALAAGDLSTPILFTSHRDCVGRMTKAMHRFQDAARASIVAEDQADTLRKYADGERTRTDADRAELAAQQRLVVDTLASGLGRLAEGDLTCTLDEPFAAEYERVRGNFNTMVGALRAALGAVIVNTGALRAGTDEIAQASDDLSRRTEQQAASLEQTAAALDEITATVKRTAKNSTQAQASVSAAKQDAEHTTDVVRDAIAAMGKIDEFSRHIGQIIGVIDEMAFQTNLLALNAGVEAARAGDAGRGFAVVASEVRALAQRSTEASKEIKALVYASDVQVKMGVGLVGEAGKALSRIIQQVGDIDKLVADIASSASEQAMGLAEVNTAVNQMDQVTQQNAAMVEQATAATHNLRQETDELGKLVSRFQVSGQAALTPQRTASPAKPVAIRRAALKMVASGGAATASAESWEEF